APRLAQALAGAAGAAATRQTGRGNDTIHPSLRARLRTGWTCVALRAWSVHQTVASLHRRVSHSIAPECLSAAEMRALPEIGAPGSPPRRTPARTGGCRESC